MKEKSGQERNISIAKKVISILLVVTLVMTGFPSALFEGALPAVLTAIAANKDHVTKKYPDVYPDSRTDFYQNGAYMIFNVEDLSKYSQAYYQYPENHQEDIVTLAYSTGTSTDTIPDFFGLGSSAYPFKGTIRISSGSDNVVNIPESFFDYVYDSVQITVDVSGGNAAPAELALSRITDGTGEPVLAKHVRHDADYEGEAVNWQVRVKGYYDGNDNWNYDNAGILGEMEDGARLILDIKDDNGTATDIVANKVTGDVGRVCGKMGQNAELTVNSVSGTNTGYRISTSVGNAGGIVGSMDAGAVLTINCQMGNTSPTVTAAGSGKYAGGLVGKNDGGTVVLGDAYADAQYVVDGSVSGTAGAGGLFGYYRPEFEETAEGSGVYEYEYDVSRYSVNVTGSGSGSVGGLFGVLENKRVVDGADTAGGTVNIIASDSGHKTVTMSGSGSASNYGGLIGKYRAYALGSVLNIGISGKAVAASVSKSGSYDNYGGGIGQIETTYDDTAHPAYVKFDGFTASASGADLDGKFFGGLVGRTSASFIDANDVTVTTSGNFEGGGVVGWLGDGVLRMTGTTDLSNAQAEVHTAYQNGQIVGYRDNALVFAEKDWQLSRSSAAIDDIGSWGEVLRFGSATEITMNGIVTKTENMSGNAVLTVNETAHTVEIGAPATGIGSVAEFAKTALCFQIDASGNSLISFAGGAAYQWNTIVEQDITLTADVDLTGNGLTGFTRDNAQTNSSTADKCVYKGTFSGGGYTVTLAIGEPKGAIYRHRYNGLFGILNGGKIKNVNFDGNCSVSAATDDIYAGAGAARAIGNFTAKDVNVGTQFTSAGSHRMYMGRLLGEAAGEIGNISVTNTADSAYGVFSGDMTGNNSHDNSCFGGVIGRISHSSAADLTWEFENIVLSGDISNTATKYTQQIGGLVAYIANTANNTAADKRKLTLNNIRTKGLVVSGTTGSSGTSQRTSGGLLGYAWYNTDVDVDKVIIGADDGGNASKVELNNSANGYGDLGGVIYSATGKWDVTELKLNEITVNAPNVKSFGMIVNRGWYSPEKSGNFFTSASSSAIYLLLNNTSAYKIDTADLTLPDSNLVFDELVAYSAYYREENGTRYATDAGGDPYVLQNGQGIVSIHTDVAAGLVMDGENASNSYQLQSGYAVAKSANPWTRYYYNLDTVTSSDGNQLSKPQQKLMSWGLNQYAHKSIKSNFANPFNNNVFADEEYSMGGYSWYPVDISSNVTVKGTFEFKNGEFEDSEGRYSFKRTSLELVAAPYTTQHYMLHEGLFRNVNGCTLTVGTDNNSVTFKGNIGAMNSSDGTGVLVFGKIAGSLNATAKIDSSSGGIVLDGIYVHNFKTKASTYAPLLINKADSYTDLIIHNVSVGIWYKNNLESKEFPYAATSLIGAVGSSSAQNINIEFNGIQIDGRDGSKGSVHTTLDSVYPTTHSIFTRATLLESFSYTAGSDGIYDFNLEEDWEKETDDDPETPDVDESSYSHAPGKVTYGSELSDSTGRNQYFGEEFWYKNTKGGIYTNYALPLDGGDAKDGEGNLTAPVNFSNFLPYVATASTAANVKTEKHFQLRVNHSISVELEGCGTYNDPYVITDGEQLKVMADIMHGDSPGEDTIIILPNVEENGNLAEDELVVTSWDKYGHSEFKYSGGVYKLLDADGNPAADENYSVAAVREYLAGAYYKIERDITLPGGVNGFKGLGYVTGTTADDKASVFRGVIVGNGQRTITNNSDNPLIYSSYGSVVKDINVVVTSAITRTQSDNSVHSENATSCQAYGAVIGQILGGDNIIDQVTVAYNADATITLSGTYAYLIPVGGYVGVVVNGALIFRGMEGYYNATYSASTRIRGIAPDSTIVRYASDGDLETDLVAETNTKWLYVNPIVGRVLNGYAVTESTAYRPFETGTRTYPNGETVSKNGAVTMRNGTKNYSIADINKSDTNAVENPKTVATSTYTQSKGSYYKTTVIVPNDQALFLLAALVQSKTTAAQYSTVGTRIYKSDSYGAHKTTHTADYNKVGNDGSKASLPKADSGHDYLKAQKDSDATATNTTSPTNTAVPYVIGKYADTGVFCVSNSNTICDMVLSKSGDNIQTFYLPDGFKGLGSYLVNNNYISLHQFNGNGNTVSLNMSLEYYKGTLSGASTNRTNEIIDNYCPETETGFGLFNYLRQNLNNSGDVNGQIQALTISGNVKTQIYQKSGEIVGYGYLTGDQNMGYSIASVGGLAGNAGNGNNDIIRIENVKLDNLYVFGPKTVGGLIGYARCGSQTAYIYDCSADKLIVSAGQEAGGLLGASADTKLQIDGDSTGKNGNSIFKVESVNIISNLTGGNTGNTFQQNQNRTFYAGGLVGRSGLEATIENMTVGTLQEDYSGFIGNSDRSNDTLNEESPEGTVYDGSGGIGGSVYRSPKKPWSIAGGVIGAVSTNGKSLTVNNCNVYNLKLYGGFSAGISARPEGTATVYNCEVRSTQSESDMSRADGKSPYMITAWYGAGGLVGEPRSTNTIEGCSIENYVIRCYSEDNNDNRAHAGGLVGRSNGSTATVRNCSVSKCYIEGRKTTSVDKNEGIGGIVGINEAGIQGYNVLINDIKLLANSGSSFDYREISATNANILPNGYVGGVSQGNVKITGFSLQVSADNTAVKDPWYAGQGPSGSYGVTNYFINADYNGACVYMEDNGNTYTKRGLVFSEIKDNTGNVQDNTVNPAVKITDNSPYVTTSPKVMIDAENFLTGDAMESLTFEKSIAKKIVDDAMKDEADRPAQYYQNIRLSFPGAFAGTSAKNTMYSFDTKPSGSQLTTMKALYPELYRDGEGNELSTEDYPTYADIYLAELNMKFSTYQAGMQEKAGVSEEFNFPILIVDDSNPSNTTELINNYLRILTNTDYNFAAGTFSDGTSASAVFNVSLAKCTYDKEKGKFVADYTSGAASLKNQSPYFKIEGDYDNTNSDGQFTLIDVKFLDPSGSGKVAYHLYVPVLVKKVMKYDFEVSLLSGTTYRLEPYENAPRGNSLIENLGNPITLEARWVYRWTIDEWTTEVKNGENLLRTYNKKLLIENNRNAGFPDNTRMVLVDANAGNKAYYADIGDDGVYTTGADNYLNLNQFKASDGETAFKSIKFNDFFDITVVAGGTGFVQVAAANDEAAVTAGAKVRAGDGNYYRPYNADTDEGNVTQVGLNFAFKEGMYEEYGTGEDAYCYLKEDYYVSFYTQAEEDSIYHIVFTSPITFGDNTNPSDVNLREDAHLFVGDIYENTSWIDEGDTRSDVEVDIDHTKIGATLNADIRLTDHAGPVIHSYLDYNSINIFQSFLIYLNRQEESGNERGIKTVPVVEVTSYTVGGTDVKSRYENDPASTNNGTITNNYIELRNDTNLKSYLKAAYNKGTGSTFRISAAFTLDYVGERDADTGNRILQQFPQRDASNLDNHSIGTKIGGASNISSSPSTTAFSKMSAEDWGDTMYYTAANATASLIYSSNDATNVNGEYDQLGINARELTDTEIMNGYANVKTLAAYDVIQLSQAEKAGSMKLKISLRRKDDYDEELGIADYIKADSLTVRDADGTGVPKNGVSTGKEFVYIVNDPKENLDYDPDSKIYKIPIDFSVFTGVNANFEGNDSIEGGAVYSNYMVKLEIELYAGEDGTGEMISGSYAGDHVIYTNAKMITDIVK